MTDNWTMIIEPDNWTMIIVEFSSVICPIDYHCPIDIVIIQKIDVGILKSKIDDNKKFTLVVTHEGE